MRQMISGLIATIAVVAAGTLPAKACGGFFDSCGCGYVVPCATAYVPAYVYGCAGCGVCGGCGWWGYERLPDPAVQYHSAILGTPQYYYVNQGPTYTGPGNFAPYPYYQESAISGRGYRYARPHYRGPIVPTK